IQIREASSGTAVKVSCGTKQVAARPEPASSGTRSGSSGHLKSAAEIREYNEERAREIQMKRESFERESTARMQQFDKPVYPGAATAHYRDDAPPLMWPSWLVAVAGAR